MISAMILKALTVLAFIGAVNFKRIIPRDEKPLKLDINNLSQTGDYIFHFYLEEDSLDGRKV
jgi:hypothetical protein